MTEEQRQAAIAEIQQDEERIRRGFELNRCDCLFDDDGKQVEECPLHRNMRLRALPAPGSDAETAAVERMAAAMWLTGCDTPWSVAQTMAECQQQVDFYRIDALAALRALREGA